MAPSVKQRAGIPLVCLLIAGMCGAQVAPELPPSAKQRFAAELDAKDIRGIDELVFRRAGKFEYLGVQAGFAVPWWWETVFLCGRPVQYIYAFSGACLLGVNGLMCRSKTAINAALSRHKTEQPAFFFRRQARFFFQPHAAIMSRPMKSSPLESILSLGASVSGLLAVFHRPLGLSDTWEWCFLILTFVFLTPVLILQRRRRTTRLAAGLPPLEKPPSKRRFWLFLAVIVAASVSGPLWLPHTGVVLPASTEIATSIIACLLAVLAYLFSWRYWNKKV
jgi:hypothetical protein